MRTLARGPRRGTIVAMAVAFLLASVLYVQTAAPSVQWGDSGEFQTVALVGGIPHATGYPLFRFADGHFISVQREPIRGAGNPQEGS